MPRYWQDLHAQEQFNTGKLTITHDDILEFAAEFDPQPYHLDSDAADESIFGGLCASGWQVSALMMRLLTDCFQEQNIAINGVAGVPEMRWKIPVFAGDTLHALITVKAIEAPDKNQADGVVLVDVEVYNQDRKPVIRVNARLLIASHSQESAA